MFAIIRPRWQTRPLSRRAKRRSSAAPGSLRKKYAGIAYPPNMVRSPNNSTTSGDPRKPVLLGYRRARQSPQRRADSPAPAAAPKNSDRNAGRRIKTRKIRTPPRFGFDPPALDIDQPGTTG